MIPQLSGPERSPASEKSAKQLVIFLHGLGANGNDLIGLADMLSQQLPDAHFVSPNAPFPCDMAPVGYQWFSLREWSEEKMLDGIRIAAPVLEEYIATQAERFSLALSQVALVGFSQGTMMSLHVGPRQSEALAGIVGYSGALVQGATLIDELQSKPDVCLIHGEVDMVVPFSCMEQAQSMLQEQGMSVKSHARPMLGHGIDPQGLEIAGEFLKKQFAI